MKIAVFLAATATLALGACSTTGAFDPQTAAQVGSYTKAFACGLSSAAAAAQGIEGQTYGGAKPIVDDKGQQITQIVYASSTAACSIIGGIVTATATVPATTPVVTK